MALLSNNRWCVRDGREVLPAPLIGMFRELEHSVLGPAAVNVRLTRSSATAGHGFFLSPTRASFSRRPGSGLALPSMQSCIICLVTLASSRGSRRMNPGKKSSSYISSPGKPRGAAESVEFDKVAIGFGQHSGPGNNSGWRLRILLKPANFFPSCAHGLIAMRVQIHRLGLRRKLTKCWMFTKIRE